MGWIRAVDDNGAPVQCKVDIAKVGRRVKTRILKFEIEGHVIFVYRTVNARDFDGYCFESAKDGLFGSFGERRE